jgi:hypothetical protein
MKGVGWSFYEKTDTCREDDEKDPQLRSRLIEILNVPERVRLRFRLASGLVGWSF